MIAPRPPKPRYNTKRLREAINARAQADALAVHTLIHTAKKVENANV